MRSHHTLSRIAAGLCRPTPDDTANREARTVADVPSFEEVMGDIGTHLLLCLGLAVAAQLLVPLLGGQ